jgi:hypothetical protein
MKKCCFCIPLRAGTFLIALWFFVFSSFEAITGFLGRNAILSYVSQTNKSLFWIEESLAVVVALGGLVGIIGTCFATRGFIRAFSIVTWINCVFSVIQHVSSLIVVGVNRQNLINECSLTLTGKFDASPAEVTPLYTPIMRNHTLGAQPDSNSTIGGSPDSNSVYATCAKEVEIFLIVAAVVVVVVQFIQFYFGMVVAAYAAKLTSQPKHTKLMMPQEWDEQRMPMRESVY